MEGLNPVTAATSVLESQSGPIILQEGSEFEVVELWKWLCDGAPHEEWKERIGILGFGHSTFKEYGEVWAKALLWELGNSKHQAEASRILAKLLNHAEEVGKSRKAYAPETDESRLHVYWPSLEGGQIYSKNFVRHPKKFITRKTKIASAGSCFAMNVGKALKDWGFNYFITEQPGANLTQEQAKAKHYGNFSARYGIIFNTPSLRQLVERGLGVFKPKPYLYQFLGPGAEHGLWFDPYRESVHFESPEEYLESLPAFEQALRRTLLEAEVFILTLGVNEVWYFKNDGTFLSRVPWKSDPALLGRKVLSVEENLANLQRLHDVWLPHNPNLQIIVTVSPVPLMKTFRGDETDIVVANCHSKSTLRVVAEEFARRNDNVTYFPAYETVMYGSRNPFEPDGRHVTKETIQRVMGMFRESFCLE